MKRQEPTVRSFVVWAYGLTWVLLGPWFYAVNVVYHGNIPSWMWAFAPVAFIGGWGPSVAALIVTRRTGGGEAVRRMTRALVAWRVPARWYVVTFALPPLISVASLLIADHGSATLHQFNWAAALRNLPIVYAIALPFGPLGEEIGWRGFALPRLMSRFGPVRATLLLGAIWTLWHAPMMLWSPGAALPSFMRLPASSVAIYLVQTTAETALMTYLFVRTNGSVLLAVIAHLTFNTAEAVVFGGLPTQMVEQLHSTYLINVALSALLGAMALGAISNELRSRVDA